MPNAATRAERSRRITVAAKNPETTAPTVPAASAAPSAALLSSRPALRSGMRGTMFANIAPFVRNSAATATRAWRVARAGAGRVAVMPLLKRVTRGAVNVRRPMTRAGALDPPGSPALLSATRSATA
jgi:hypothetical protein